MSHGLSVEIRAQAYEAMQHKRQVLNRFGTIINKMADLTNITNGNDYMEKWLPHDIKEFTRRCVRKYSQLLEEE